MSILTETVVYVGAGVAMRDPAPPRKPASVPGHRDDAEDMAGTGRTIRGRYDAAGDGLETRNIWINADALDADSANSLSVRKRLRERSRLEQANNGYAEGMHATHAIYAVGRGPKLRMETLSDGFNRMVQAAWQAWCKATGFARKLRTMQRAKAGDGEGFGVIKNNPAVADKVKLDLQLIECDQVTTPFLPWGEPGKIDGLEFDDFGNVVDYQILKYHPGSSNWTPILNPENYPDRFVCHLYDRKRPGQHRGVPTCSSTLNLSATGRRYREAVVAAAEQAADLAVMVEMQAPNEGPDEVRPFSTIPTEKRMAMMLPAGGKASQMKAEQPTTTYDSFVRSQVSEQSRPFSMSHSIAACDSSGNSFSGTQNDHLIYYAAVDVEQADIEEDVLEKVFALWFQEAVWAYGWAVPDAPAPKHSWSWPGRPKIDEEKTANARKVAQSAGQTTLSRIYDEDGYDFDEDVEVMAKDYGVTADDMRLVLLCQNFSAAFTAVPDLLRIVAGDRLPRGAADSVNAPPSSQNGSGGGNRILSRTNGQAKVGV